MPDITSAASPQKGNADEYFLIDARIIHGDDT